MSGVESVVARIKGELRIALSEAWQQGYTSGHSDAKRQTSASPNAPTTPNPYCPDCGGAA